MTIAVILVNWRNEQQTVGQASALNSWQKLKPLVIVIDNEATEESQRALAPVITMGEVIPSAVNLGYAGGNNLGIKHALAAGYEYILLLNSDVDLSEESAIRLVQQLRDCPNVSILGPAVRERESGGQVSIGGRDIARHAFTRQKLAHDDNVATTAQLYSVDYVPGTLFLTRASVFKEIGLLDEEYFFSGEIADFCKRAKERGHNLRIDPAVEAHHQPKSSAGPIREVLYTYYNLRNRFLYVKKHYTSSRFLYFIFWTAIGSAMLLRALGSRKPAKARAILLALAHGYTHRFGNQNAHFSSSINGAERA